MGFTHSGFFVLRTPLLPFEVLDNWSVSANTTVNLRSSSGEASARLFVNSWHADAALLRDRLWEIVQRSEIRLALYLASPSLESSIDAWRLSPDTKKGLQTERSLVRYLSRMAARPTPFGLFSGCSVGSLSNGSDGSSELRLAPRTQYTVKAKLDYTSLFSLTDILNSDPSVAAQLSYHPNSSLYQIGGSWHYLESRSSPSLPTHSLIRVLTDPYLECAISTAANGATLNEISHAIVTLSNNELTLEEVHAYVQELVKSQILISSLQPNVTGADPLTNVAEQLSALRGANNGRFDSVLRLKGDIERLESRGIEAKPSDYRNLIPSEFAGGPNSDQPVGCQVDLVKPLTGVLSDVVAKHLSDAMHLMRSLGVAPPDPRRKLAGFRLAFRARYGQSLMPLAEVLNDDVGIGVDGKTFEGCSSLLEGIPRRDSGLDDGTRLTGFHQMLLNKVLACVQAGETEVQLAAPDGESYKPALYDLPTAFSVTATIVASSAADIPSGNFSLLMRAAAGPSGVTAMGRFCHAVPGLEAYVREHIKQEEALDPDVIFAEIAYLPLGRLGNILYRPVLRGYEIAYLGRSGAPPERQIPISDLLVTLTDKDEIVLFSMSLDKQIIPRLTSAHTFNRPQLPPVYRFLCYLQYEHWKAVPSFDWGPLDSLSFLPRLRAGKVILSPAKWNISHMEIKAISKTNHRPDIFREVQAMRGRLKIPRWITLVEADQLLPVDLDNVLSVDAFVQVMRRSETATLEEMVCDSRDLPITSIDGRFQHEVVVPFVFNVPAADKELVSPPAAQWRSMQSPQSFSVYSEWMYLKIFGGTGVLDEFLRDIVPKIIATAFAEQLIISWFFLRFDDPKLHLNLDANPPGAPVLKIVLGAEAAKRQRIQGGLFIPKGPEPQQLEVTLARLRKLVGADRVGAAEVIERHTTNTFRMVSFQPRGKAAETQQSPVRAAIRIFRPHRPATVRNLRGAPVTLAFDGQRYRVTKATGPWRRSGEWWTPELWGRDEWDLALIANEHTSLIKAYRNLLNGEWYVEGEYD